jgi:hypothetical protein
MVPAEVASPIDVITRFRAATEAADVEAIMSLLAPDAELVSPIFKGLVIRGEGDIRTLFDAVYASIRDLRWVDQVADERLAMLRGESRIGPARLDDAMVLEFGPDGLIKRVRPHFRPWLGICAFFVIVGARLLRHPGLFIRSARHR